MPIELSSVTDREAPQRPRLRTPLSELLGQRKPGNRERMFFTEQLSLLLETGTPLHAALLALGQQTRNPGLKETIATMVEDISGGKSFSHALQRHGELFSATYVNLVAAAETGGFLDKVLLELLKMDERRESLHRTLVSALTYPVFLLLFSFAVVIFVLVSVFPKFAEMFERIHDQLPASTHFLIGASDLLINHWAPLLAVLAGMVAALWYWVRTPSGAELIDQAKMRLFFIRDVFIQVYLIQSMRVLGLSLANGVSVMDALASCRDVVRNRVFRRFLTGIEKRVEEGSGFSAAFQQADFIPPAVQQMVTTGEESGALPRVLTRVADYYERELEKRLGTFSRLVEPIMLLVMGGVVGLIVSSLILPIFKLSSAVG